MKRILSFIACAALVLCLCGCKGYRETDSEYIISAIGFEANTAGFNVYAEVLDMESGENKSENRVFNCFGITPYEAVDNLNCMLSKTAVFDHCAIAVISDEIRGDRLKEVLTYLYNTRNLNLGVYMYKTKSVTELFGCKPQSTGVGYDVMAIEESAQKTSGISFKNKYYEIIGRIYENGGFSLPLLGIKDKSPLISGQAVFKDLSPAVTLNEQEGMIFNLLYSGSSGGEISIAGKRCRVNGITPDLSAAGECVYAKLICGFRFKDDNLCDEIKGETEKLLDKIIAANALSVLGVSGDIKTSGVSVYGK